MIHFDPEIPHLLLLLLLDSVLVVVVFVFSWVFFVVLFLLVVVGVAGRGGRGCWPEDSGRVMGRRGGGEGREGARLGSKKPTHSHAWCY